MNGGGNAPPPPIPAANGGEFLLSLLQKPQATTSASPPPPPPPLAPAPQSQPPPRQQPQQSLAVDPAVAAVGPSLPFPPPHLWQSNGQDLLHPLHWPLVHSLATTPSPFAPNGFLGFPHSFFPTQFQGNQVPVNVGDDHRRLGFPSGVNQTQSRTQNPSSNLNSVHGIVLQKNQLEHKLKFGSLPSEIAIVPEGSPKVDASNSNNLMNRSRQVNSNSSSIAVRNAPPPGFSSKPRRMGLNPNAGGENSSSGNLTRTRDVLAENVGTRGDSSRGLGLSAQLDRPGPPSGSNLRSVKASDVEDSMMKLENAAVEDGGSNEIDDLGQRLVDSLLVEDESDDKNEAKQHKNHREKDSRSDSRGQRLLNQRMRAYKRQMRCRVDIDRLNDAFITIVKSLIPAEEEKAKQQQLLTLLEKLIIKEWPTARLYLYGSCANSFGVSKSDVDLCLVMEDMDINKAEVLLKLADILQSDNLQNVQALTRARVPIVKLMDPATGISCDICINNVLAVVNTRLLRDYARIDMRLRHLAFIVKHWAKSRGVNETYQGTLSSYAYVLMCIHFLQQRRPAILPCLQGMEATYSVTVDNIECAYFDQVEKLRDFGSHNKETVSQLVWGFFNYWAYRHDYTDSVISVRTGSIISKREKDWTRRIGNDRHLICIEDPFETSHDLGRVVDKHSIRVLREEFERAAEIMQFDPNPCVTLFEPYIPS